METTTSFYYFEGLLPEKRISLDLLGFPLLMAFCVKIDIDLSHSLKLKFEGNIKLFFFFKFDLLYFFFLINMDICTTNLSAPQLIYGTLKLTTK